jgi:uncharacterized protein YukE
MSDTPTAPEKLTEVQQNLQHLQGQLSTFTWQGVMGIANNRAPEQYAAEAINKVVTYIKEWFVGPESVHDVAQRWVKLSSGFQNVTADCQRQLGLIKNHWSGLAAENFSAYSDQLLAELQRASPATSGVATNLGNLAQNLYILRNEIITGGAITALDAVVGAINIGNQVLTDISADEVVVTVLVPPLGIARYCTDVTTKIANQVATVIKDLINMEKAVSNSLAQMSNSALGMQNSLYSQLPMSGVPAEPPGLNETDQWTPKQ